jgi:hypothetical protein
MKRTAALLAIAFATLIGPAAQAAPGDGWDGVWSPIENNMFDPSQGRLDPNFARMHPPYKPDWEARYVTALESARAGKPTDPTASCVPGGMPRIMANPYPQEIIVKAKQVTIPKELQTQIRRIYTDGRKAPGDPDRTYNGYSTGHWEGDTLVVETIGLRGDTVFDRTAAPHSDQIKVQERMRLKSKDVWEDQLTVIDPVALTKPWVVTRTYQRQPDWEILEYVCEENNRNALNPDGTNGFNAKAAR